MKFDSSITLSLVIALAAIVSPVITTYLNNKHQLKLLIVEKEFDRKKEYEEYINSIINNFLKNVGNFIAYPTSENLSDFEESFYILMMIIPKENYYTFQSFLNNMVDQDFELCRYGLENEIIPILLKVKNSPVSHNE